MNKEAKANLALLIHELQDILSEKTRSETSKVIRVGEILDIWVNANDLHPENVETLSPEEAKRRFGI